MTIPLFPQEQGNLSYLNIMVSSVSDSVFDGGPEFPTICDSRFHGFLCVRHGGFNAGSKGLEVTDISYESMHVAMEASGYKLQQTSPQGSRLYTCDGKPPYRVAHFEPNDATAAWMQRVGAKFGRVTDSGEPFARPGELPEFGLESTDDYHSDTSAISKSMLSVFMDSPVEYYHQFITGLMPRKAPTKRMKIGTICHAILLEHKKIEEVCVQYPYSCLGVGDKLISGKAKEFEQRMAKDGLIAVKEDSIRVIETTIRNARASEFGALLDLHADNAKYEVRIDEEIYGLKAKCRPDIHIVLADQVIVPDLKFGAFKDEDWKRVSNRFRYWLQTAHYSAILEKRYQRPVSWSFWAFETEFPYRVGPKRYGPRSIEIAANEHKNQMKALKQCYDTGIWKDHFQTEIELDPWSIGDARNSEETPTENTEYEETQYDATDDTAF